MVSVLTFSNKIESVLTKLLNQYNSTAHHSIALRNHGFLSPCIQEVNIFILSHHDKLLNNRITNIDRAVQLPDDPVHGIESAVDHFLLIFVISAWDLIRAWPILFFSGPKEREQT